MLIMVKVVANGGHCFVKQVINTPLCRSNKEVFPIVLLRDRGMQICGLLRKLDASIMFLRLYSHAE